MAQRSIEPGVARQGAADVGVVVPVVRLLLRQRIRRAGQFGKIDDLAAFTPLYGKLLVQPLQNPKIAKKESSLWLNCSISSGDACSFINFPPS